MTEPVDASQGRGISMYSGPSYAILNSSHNVETAWSIIEYLTGEERAQSLSAVDGSWNALPARRIAAVDEYGAFYDLPRAESASSSAPTMSAFVPQFEPLANRAFMAVLDGEKTLEQALTELQNEAQALLDTVAE